MTDEARAGEPERVDHVSIGGGKIVGYVNDEARAGEPRWDGEVIDGRPVAHCQECGALRYVEDIEYIGEAALGGPNFSYRLGDLAAAAPVLDVSRCRFLTNANGERCQWPRREDHDRAVEYHHLPPHEFSPETDRP